MSDNYLIYIYCKKDYYCFYEDYIVSINKKLNAKIIFDLDTVNIMKDDIIIVLHRIHWLFSIVEKLNIKKIFLLNTEQLTIKENLDYIKKYSKIYTIIDYSKENIDIMKKNNINNTIYFPYIYNEDEIYNSKKTLSICGVKINNSPRRKELIKNIEDLNIIKGWNQERDSLMFKHKILINIYKSENHNVFESMRCYRCLFNKMIVISEEKYDSDLIDYSKHILFAKITDIPELVKDVLLNYEEYYKKLDIDNVDYKMNNHLIEPKKLDL